MDNPALEDKNLKHDPASASLALVHACDAARACDGAALQSRLEEFYRLSPSADEKLTFLACVLDNLPDYEIDARGNLLRALKDLRPENNIESSLCAARNAALLGNDQDCARYFFHALALADNFYRDAWPDIGAALKEHVFICSLHHYALHGKSEGRGWRDLWHFFFALQALQSFIPVLAETHMRIYDYADRELAKKMICSLLE